MDIDTKRKYEKEWLKGYTCNHQTKLTVVWISECKNYVIMKHTGHTVYVDRVVGHQYCGTYYALMHVSRISTFNPNISKDCLEWKGRFKHEYFKQAEEWIKNDRAQLQ